MQQRFIVVNFSDTAAGVVQRFPLCSYDALYDSIIKETALGGERLSPGFQPLSPSLSDQCLHHSFALYRAKYLSYRNKHVLGFVPSSSNESAFTINI